MSDGDAAPATGVHESPLPCPLCGYDLRSSRDRCPECGAPFDAAAMRAERQNDHPYLFEHHPQRNIRSWWQTFVASNRPNRFWQTLQPRHRPRVRRMMIYWVIAGLSLFVALGVSTITTAISLAMSYAYQRPGFEQLMAVDPVYQRYIARRVSSVQAYADAIFPRLDTANFYNHVGHALPTTPAGWLALVYITWPWVTFGLLLLFQPTLRRAKVGRAHLLRVVIYSDSAPAIGLALIGLSFVWSWHLWQRRTVYSYYWQSLAMHLVLIGLTAVFSWRLATALRRYLHLADATIIAISVQGIVFLLAMWVLSFQGYRETFWAIW